MRPLHLDDHKITFLNQLNCIFKVKVSIALWLQQSKLRCGGKKIIQNRQIVLDCVLSCMIVGLLHLLIAQGDIRAQRFGRSNFPRLDILSSMHIDQVCSIHFDC